MSKITIYTTADKRPEFIELQFKSFKKYLKDDYKYVVINNAISSKTRRDEINKICNELGIECWKVTKDKKKNIIGQQKAMSFLGFYKNPNVATEYPIKLFWEKMITDNADSSFVIIDSDMFISSPISFEKEVSESDLASIIHYRGLSSDKRSAAVSYIWNGICVFTPAKKNLLDFNWDCGLIKKAYVNNFPVDVGGYSHYWLNERRPKIRHMTEYTIRTFKITGDKVELSAVLNGCYSYSFSYDVNTKEWSDYLVENMPIENSETLPHLPNDFKDILIKKTINYFEKFILNKPHCPDPIFLAFVEFENFKETPNDFVIHMKAGSGYVGFDSDYYNLKFNFIKDILKINLDYKHKNTYIRDFYDLDIKVIAKLILRKINFMK